MPIYLADVSGGGSDANPFRCVGNDEPGAGWIDLGGRGILWRPSSLTDPRVTKLADAIGDVIPLSLRTRIGNALSVTATKTRAPDLLAELLGSLAGGRWQPLRAEQAGVYRIWLGTAAGGGPILESPSLVGGVPVFWIAALTGLRREPRLMSRRTWLALVALAASLGILPRSAFAGSVTETWPTNGTNIATGQDNPWTETLNDLQVVSNKLEPVTTAARCAARCNTGVGTENHKTTATITIATLDSGTRNAAVSCRFAAAADTYYALQCDRITIGNERDLLKRVAGAFTALATDAVDVGASATVWTVQANGSTIQATQGSDTLGPVTDTAIAGNTQGGCELRVPPAGSPPNLDDWILEDLATPRRTLLGVGT